MGDFKNKMKLVAQGCDLFKSGDWIIPSPFYKNYFFARDSFWILSTLKNADYFRKARTFFHEKQKKNLDGHINSAEPIPPMIPDTRKDKADESVLMDILREYELFRMDGSVDSQSLNTSLNYILKNHFYNGFFVTKGESRLGSKGENDLNTYHYWADSFRPNGDRTPTPMVFGYNQGLFCVALKCLEEMRVPVDPNLRIQAEKAYAAMANSQDGISLPQRVGTDGGKYDAVDVSALTGEALSLYYFDRPLLPDAKVNATINRFSKVNYPDSSFLGFRVITGSYGSFRPQSEFVDKMDDPGNYQNGGSWMLYDALALYAASRHGIKDAADFFVQRLSSEAKKAISTQNPDPKAFSHEFIKTGPGSLGEVDLQRDGYGWNSFVSNLLP